jgi:dienelactone hydrolase
MRVIRLLAGLTAVAVAGIGLMLGVLWADHTRETALPMPTGPFAVGRTTMVWSDPANMDPMAPAPGAKRELAAWIWYPASSAQTSGRASDYLPPAWREAVDRQRGFLIGHILTRDLSRVKTHSVEDADVSPLQPAYPVILMRAGLSALVASYSSLAEDLASHGYIVVGFDAPYRSSLVVFPDGRVIPRAAQNNADLLRGTAQLELATRLVQAWSADMSFALDQLERMNTSDGSGKFRGRLDLQRVGAFGHSLGGAEALQFCHEDTRCKAGVDLDGAPLGGLVQTGLRQPFLLLLADSGHGDASDPENQKVVSDFHTLYDHLPPQGSFLLVIRGANHFLFSDDAALLKSPLAAAALRTFGFMRIDGRRQLAVTAPCIVAFFDAQFKTPSTPKANVVSPLYPEIEVLP